MKILKQRYGLGVWLPLLLSEFLCLSPVTLTAQAVDEYAVKAVFLYNFTKFIEWPTTPGSSPFTICIVGDDPFGAAIDKLVEGKSTAGRPIEIRRLKDETGAQFCQIAFVRSLEKSKGSKLIDATRGMRVLTVGETEDFGKTGGLVYLSMGEDRVGVAINTTGTEQVGLKVSAKLLTLAKIFKSDRRP